MSKSSDAPNATRQMLDELDALMERMLALPVNEAPAAVAEPERPALAATLTLLKAPATELPPAAPHAAPKRMMVGRFSPPSYTAPADGAPTEEALEQRAPIAERPAAVAPPPEELPAEPSRPLWEENESVPSPDEVLPPLIGWPPVAPPPNVRPRRHSLRSRALQPLVWLNRKFDRATHWLGLPGRWLRSARGRAVLGYVGLTLIGVAIAWSLRDWLGWWW